MAKAPFPKWLPLMLGGVLLIMIITPLFWPLPPSSGVHDARDLADADSQFITVDGVEVHYKSAGSGEPAILLLHSGAHDSFSWREVMAPLSASHRVVAYDRNGYGLSSRPTEWKDANPYSASFQADLLPHLMDALGIKQAIVVGSSAGATVGMLSMLRHPGRFVGAVLVGPGLYSGADQGMGTMARLLMRTPHAQRLGPAILERQFNARASDLFGAFWHDSKRITPEILAGYTRHTKVKNWSWALFQQGLSMEPLHIQERLKELGQPMLIVSGAKDQFVPAEENEKLAKELPKAEAVSLPECGHLPQEECAEPFLKAVVPFIEKVSAQPR